MLPEEPRSAESTPSFVRWTQGMINRFVAASDSVTLLLVALAASQFHLLGLPAQLLPIQILVVALVELVVFQFVLSRLGGYRVERYTHPVAAPVHIIGALVPAWAVTLVLLGAFAPGSLRNPGWLLAWHLLQPVALLLLRLLQAAFMRGAQRRRLLRRRIVVVGTGPEAERTVAELSAASKEDNLVLAVFRDAAEEDEGAEGSQGPERVGGVPVLGGLGALRRFAQTRTIDVVVLALPWSRAEELFGLVDAVGWVAADVVIPFDPAGHAPNFAAIVPLGPSPALQVISRPFKGTQGVVKLLEDYVVASVALVLLSPLMLLSALAIRLEDGGPVLFRQWRPGFGGKPFAIYKFRTMRVNPNDDATIGTTGPRDPRVTRVGSVLRRLSLDELPQLFNVLKGEMSVVGPRPYVADMLVGNERFSDLMREYAARHRIKPGMTGYAQANGMRSYALRSAENARRSIEMDIHYMTHWSLWLDIKIMLRTLLLGLAGRHVF